MSEYKLARDGVQARTLNEEERALLETSRARMLQVRAPNLMESTSDRLFVAALDGTGNDMENDPAANLTVVAQIKESIEALRDPSIAVSYVKGVGTQSGSVAGAIDGAFSVTLEERAEQAYLEFCRQSAVWLEEDPQARIHVAGIGFSRGAETVPLLQRLVDERGIRNPADATARYDKEGLLTSVTWADGPPLVPPGQTAQVAFLIDPVGTGSYGVDRGLPPSNVGAVQFTSLNEPRDHFTSTRHLQEGLTEAARVANLFMPGVHSDLGGSYRIDGVGRVIHNFAVDYFNKLLGEERLQKVPEPYDPRMFVVHRSEQHLYGFWPDTSFRRLGERVIHTKLGPSCQTVEPDPCLRAPIDFRLADTLTYSNVERGRVPGGSDAKMDLALRDIDAMHRRDGTLLDRLVTHTRLPLRAQALEAKQDLEAMFQQLAVSALRNDTPGMQLATRAYGLTPIGQLMGVGALGRSLLDGLDGSRSHDQIRNMAPQPPPVPSPGLSPTPAVGSP